ncbi:MAG: riboflavin synthase [Deltaproteobacteria bacterium]|nr:riboflavin synthase [Deltaproteobacteria bacterium]
MFTGIIEGTGRVKSIVKKEESLQIEVAADFDLEQTNVGESIAVNGCCLTITSRLGDTFWADLSLETMALTTLGEMKADDPVNMERPLKMGERLGGHMVQGHIDGIAQVSEIATVGDGKKITFKCPSNLARYIVEKGSIAVDGVSLTVNQVAGEVFSVMVIPHTQVKTTFQILKVGSRVNLEVDIIGKYVEKLTFLDSEAFEKKTLVTQAFLKKHGF